MARLVIGTLVSGIIYYFFKRKKKFIVGAQNRATPLNQPLNQPSDRPIRKFIHKAKPSAGFGNGKTYNN